MVEKIKNIAIFSIPSQETGTEYIIERCFPFGSYSQHSSRVLVRFHSRNTSQMPMVYLDCRHKDELKVIEKTNDNKKTHGWIRSDSSEQDCVLKYFYTMATQCFCLPLRQGSKVAFPILSLSKSGLLPLRWVCLDPAIRQRAIPLRPWRKCILALP